MDYVGQSLPSFPYTVVSNGLSINLYLEEAGTINITAINASGQPTNFKYTVKDTLLGYTIAEDFDNYVTEKIIYVPRNRNYSIMIYPNQSLPVSFNWNNSTSSDSYNFTTANLSSYNSDNYTIQKKFNCSQNLIIINGNASKGGISGWDEFTIVPYILEPGDMVYLGDDAAMPYNMSAWNNTAYTDFYNLAMGLFDITLPGPQESADYILFATARKGTDYYGGYANLTLNYTSSPKNINFTMYSLMSTDWASSNSNITMNDATGWGLKNISSAKQKFNLVNSSNLTLSQLSAHIEVTVDYSDYGAKEFTFMLDISQEKDATFYLPLINATGIKEINVYSKDYAPKRIGTRTAKQILTNSNITLTTFNPGEIPGESDIAAGSITIDTYKSNSTCDVPNPPTGCSLTSSSNMSSFNSINSVIGGGKISFRMGFGNVLVHYANVDMMASGPPDAMFEENSGTTSSLTDAFDTALRFGSNGPKIYDYVLISIPYSEVVGSGLDDSQTVNISIPTFYDENWNVIWDSSLNGTNASSLAGNQSYYSAYQSQWQTLMTGVDCSTSSNPTSTNPCYIDTTNNRIWIRLPHFSGTRPSVSGTIASSSTGDSLGGSGGSGGSIFSFWIGTYEVTEEFASEKGYTKELSSKQRLRFVINDTYHHVGILEITPTTALINVSSSPQQARFNIGDEKKFDVTEDGYYDIKVKLELISGNKAKINVKSIHEKVPLETLEKTEEEKEELIGKIQNILREKLWIWVISGIVVLVIIIGIVFMIKKVKK